MATVQDDIKARTAGDTVDEKRANLVVGNHTATRRCRRVVIQGAKTRIKASEFITVGVADEGPVAGVMEYGFISGDHSRNEGGQPGENILAGGCDGRWERGATISIGKHRNGRGGIS